jgi:hypothetical protein
MSLRDWFAGQAIYGSTASTMDTSDADADEIAKRLAVDAYKIADALLSARKEKT